jgi:hypothetical protein
MNTHIIDHEIKLMKMGGREEILPKRETTSLIILPEDGWEGGRKSCRKENPSASSSCLKV